jgi:hypothetical protein
MAQKKKFTFRAWWNAHQHHTQFRPFRVVIAPGAKIRARRHIPSRARRQTCWLLDHLHHQSPVEGGALGTTSGETRGRVPGN